MTNPTNTHVVTTRIHAPAEVVWQTLAAVRDWPTWLATVQKVESMSCDTLRLGESFRVTQPDLRPRIWTVTELTHGCSFSWQSKSPGLELCASHLICPLDSHGCELKLEFQCSRLIGRLVFWVFGSTIKRNLIIEAAALKKHSEAKT